MCAARSTAKPARLIETKHQADSSVEAGVLYRNPT